MPWSVEDVDSHKRGLSDVQKEMWVKIANSALEECLQDGGQADECEGRAIRIANAALNEAQVAEAEQETKTEDGQQFPRSDYAYTPDGPSTWKLRLTAVPGGPPDAGMVGAACAALGKGFRGNKVEIPADDRPAVIAKVRAAWRKANPDKDEDEMPDVLKESYDTSTVGLDGETIPLVEKAVRDDGTLPIKIIAPGWGSSGYYPPEVLERDGPRVFKAGTHTYWNHPSKSEERERPERDLRDLAGVLVSDARYEADGPAGPGLYADAKVSKQYRDAVAELAPYIGMSIRAVGKAREGEVDGRKGKIIDELVAARSVDYVTTPGAGGRILELFESAGRGIEDGEEIMAGEAQNQETIEALQKQVEDLKAKLAERDTELARLREGLLLHQAQEVASAVLAEIADMPAPTKTRVLNAQTVKPIAKDDGTLDEAAFRAQVKAAADAEMEYLKEVMPTGSGRIIGMGAPQPTNSDGKMQLKEAFKRAGLSDEAAEIAAKGR